MAEEGRLGLLKLELSPGARVTAEPTLDDGVFRLSLWRQEVAIGSQVSRAGLPIIRSFNSIPQARHAMRLDLRLAPEVNGVTVERDRTELRVSFYDRRFAGDAVRLQSRRAEEARDAARNEREDAKLAVVLAEPRIARPPWVQTGPVTWPTGFASPVHPPLRLDSRPRRSPPVPKELRAAWARHPELASAIEAAELGKLEDAAWALRGLSMKGDGASALYAAARGFVLSLPASDGEPWHPGRAGDAFVLASGLNPGVPWEAWLRGMAGYAYERDRNFHESELQYGRAIPLAPDHPDRVFWQLGRGLSLIGRHRSTEGIDELVRSLGSLRSRDDAMRFELRRSIAWALWRDGETAPAAAVADLALAEHPTLARDSGFDLHWGRIYLDAGRTAAALPFLERQLAEGDRVTRERARWWLHEAALSHHDITESRRWLKEILNRTPGSTLAPLARLRLQVLDSVAVDGEGKDRSWQALSLAVRDVALAWPNTVVEDEALSIAAQLWIELDLLQDGLNMYRWLEGRTPSEGGAIAYHEIVCRTAPRAFNDLRTRGEVTRALGLYRGFLDLPSMHGCVDSETRKDAANAALSAGLPDLAARWVGQAVAEGTGGIDETRYLVDLADIYLRQGKPEAAAQTVSYLDNSDLPHIPVIVEAVRGDVLREQGESVDAAAAYAQAMDEAADSVRNRALLPELHYRRGLALFDAGQLAAALPELTEGVRLGGAEDPAVGWLKVASVGAQIAKEAAAWQAVLVATEAAGGEEPDEAQTRALDFYRARALGGLGKGAEADALLAALATGTDTWALQARRLRGAGVFDTALDGLVDPAP